MGIVLDVILVAILVWSIVGGLKHGFVYALAAFAGSVLAFIAAGKLSGLATDLLRGLISSTRVLTAEEAGILQCVATVLLFIVLMLLVQLAARALNMVFELPVLKQVNGLLGGVFGLLRGVVVALLLCVALSLAAPALQAQEQNFAREAMRSSRIYTFFEEHTPYRLFGLGDAAAAPGPAVPDAASSGAVA